MQNRKKTIGLQLLMLGQMFARDTVTGRFFKAKVFPDIEVQRQIKARAIEKRKAKADRRKAAAACRDFGYYRVTRGSKANRYYPGICGGGSANV